MKKFTAPFVTFPAYKLKLPVEPVASLPYNVILLPSVFKGELEPEIVKKLLLELRVVFIPIIPPFAIVRLADKFSVVDIPTANFDCTSIDEFGDVSLNKTIPFGDTIFVLL